MSPRSDGALNDSIKCSSSRGPTHLAYGLRDVFLLRDVALVERHSMVLALCTVEDGDLVAPGFEPLDDMPASVAVTTEYKIDVAFRGHDHREMESDSQELGWKLRGPTWLALHK